MTADHELITQTARAPFESWDVCSDVVVSAPHRENLHLVRIGRGWQIAGGLWLAQ